MSHPFRYEAEVTWELRRNFQFRAETDSEARELAIRAFREAVADEYGDTPPSASELDVLVIEVA